MQIMLVNITDVTRFRGKGGGPIRVKGNGDFSDFDKD